MPDEKGCNTSQQNGKNSANLYLYDLKIYIFIKPLHILAKLSKLSSLVMRTLSDQFPIAVVVPPGIRTYGEVGQVGLVSRSELTGIVFGVNAGSVMLILVS